MINRVAAIGLLAMACALSTLGCAVATAPPPPASAAERISVTFVQPERFTDVKDSVTGSERGAADMLGDLDRYVQSAGDRIVPAGLSLAIRITNIDLAGEFEWWRGPQFDRVRIMREIYPPRIDLQFRLADATGAVVKEGQRALRDPLYLTRASIDDSDRLRYDKELLGDWLRRSSSADVGFLG
jgi:hypothetical protein